MSVEREMVVDRQVSREEEARNRGLSDKERLVRATKGERDYFERNHHWPGEYVSETDGG
ncbi:MAG: hypothetical protein V1668_01890 [Patescibacteria group bacterium]